MTVALFQATPFLIAYWNRSKRAVSKRCFCSIQSRRVCFFDICSLQELSSSPARVQKEQGILVQDVHFAWSKTRPVLKGISFQVPRGQFCVLVGSNGSGKSTLCEVIYGSLLPHKGYVRIAKPAALIYQNPDDNLVFPTVESELTCCIRNETEQVKEKLARDALRLVGLEHLYYSRVDSLSGGEKQRVAIASLLLLHPLVLILDEPTSSMDTSSREDFLRLMKKLVCEKNMALLWVTHLVEEQRYADRLIRIQSGEIIYDGEPNKDTSSKLILQLQYSAQISNSLS